MTKSQMDTWREIRDGTFLLLLLCRRDEDLWALPTNDSDVISRWAPAGSRELEIRKKNAFGHASITVSLKALFVAREVTGISPDFISGHVLRALLTHQKDDGGYGSQAGRKDGSVEINAIPRHTASATILRLLFDDTPNLVDKLRPSIKWLLQRQRRAGGWSYDSPDKEASLGPMSTATAIYALCLFAERLTPQDAEIGAIASAVGSAYQELVNRCPDGVWDSASDGTRKDDEILDTCFNFELLLRAYNTSRLSKFIHSEAVPPFELTRRLLRHRQPDGWPTHAGYDASDSAATICALQVLSLVPLSEEDSQSMKEAERRVVADWQNNYLTQAMGSWDWMCLSELAARYSAQLTQSERQAIITRAEHLRRKWTDRTITTQDLNGLPIQIRGAATYALTKGGTAPARRALREKVQDLLWRGTYETILQLIVGFTAGVIVSQYAPLASWFSRLFGYAASLVRGS